MGVERRKKDAKLSNQKWSEGAKQGQMDKVKEAKGDGKFSGENAPNNWRTV